MSVKYRIIPIGGGGITPTGTLEIRSEGTFDVTDYAEVDVDIFDDTTTKTVTENGTYNAEDDHVLGYSQVTVSVPAASVDVGTLTIPAITQNVTLFTQDVTGYRAIAFPVQVPASEVDTGTKQITSNGTGQDVIGYAAVDVNVQPTLQAKTNIAPLTSSQTITADQNYDGLSSVQINAVTSSIDPNITASNIKDGVTILGTLGTYTGQGIVPTGTYQISQNGTYDITQYANVDVAVAASDLDYFYIEAIEATNINFTPRAGYTLYYSTDNKTTWNTMTSAVSLAQGDKMYCYGTCSPGYFDGSDQYSQFIISRGNVALGGHMCTLYYPSISYSCPQYCFYKLFMNCYGVKDISNLVLPSDIGKNSFSQTFSGTQITSFSENYISNVTECSFLATFNNCTSLTTVNAFNNIINSGKNNSYRSNAFNQIFSGCTSLVNVNAFNIDDDYVSINQYTDSFSGCSSLVDASNIFKNNVIATTNNSSFSSCFRNCSSLTIPPNFENIESFGNYAFQNTFENCTSLITGTKFATSDKNTYGINAFNSMYKGCTSLTYVYFPSLFSWSSSYTTNWLQNVSATGYVFVNTPDLSIDINSISGIPSGWTRVDVTSTADYVNNTLTISSNTGSIYYSTNESDPLSNFTLYTSPISIPQSEIDDFPARAYVDVNGVKSYVLECGAYTPFYVETIDGGTTITYNNSNYKVSTDMTTWNTASGTYTLSNAGDRLYIKTTQKNTNFNTKPTVAGADFKVGGKLVSLFSYDLVRGYKPPQYGATCNRLFYNNAYLIDISGLIFDMNLSNAQSKDMFRDTFYGCSKLTNGKFKYNSNYAGASCFYETFMFSKITESPDFSNVTQVGDNNGQSVFYRTFYTTTNTVTKIHAPNVSVWDTNCYSSWVEGVAATGTFFAPTGLTIPTGIVGIPSGWTRVDY